MNNAAKVVHFLRKRREQYFCDDCISRELRLAHPVNRITEVVGAAPGNRKEAATCGRCSENELSTMIGMK